MKRTLGGGEEWLSVLALVVCTLLYDSLMKWWFKLPFFKSSSKSDFPNMRAGGLTS